MIRSLLWAVLLTIGFTSHGLAQSTPIAFSKTVTRLEAGTVIGQEGAGRWNRTVMLAKPRIASGDVSALAESIREAVSTFVLSIVATVDLDPASSEPKYRLAEVGVGYSVSSGNQLKVVHWDDYEAHGVNLPFIQRQMLAENERQLSHIRTIARGNSLLLFDVPAILLQDKIHRDYTLRHLIWIDSKSGKLATMLWMLETDKNKRPSVVTSEAIRWVDSANIEDRAIHVDGSEFTLSIPSKRAFALEKIPAGRPIPWNQAAANLAALESYDLTAIQSLMRALNEANLASKRPR